MRKRQQSQNEGTPAVSQAPGNQRPNNTCCFCWCCCCSCSCLTVRNEERGENAGRPTHTTKMESIQVLEESQNPTSDEVLSWSQNFDKMMKAPAGRNLFREFLRTEYSEENLLFWLACEDLKKEQNKKVIEEKARMIYEDYISILSPKESERDITCEGGREQRRQNLKQAPCYQRRAQCRARSHERHARSCPEQKLNRMLNQLSYTQAPLKIFLNNMNI
ncbi:regulator of G-protein signaling 17 isoform X1 [Acinonyx jubatus]|uniref:Regulator of G-protein signaling 17 isoform X1 n=1 Tax=Acinonyx jubatus TaxID=32536 RepID=A0ABM3Q2A1_ACIJB|nr:regulator of G-protein signaling 17 isoform X1 [Acinonyx jubatus]